MATKLGCPRRAGRDPFALPKLPAAPSTFSVPDAFPSRFELEDVWTVLGRIEGFGPAWIRHVGGSALAARHVLRAYTGATEPDTVAYEDGLGGRVERRLPLPSDRDRQERALGLFTVIVHGGAGLQPDAVAALPAALGVVRLAKMLAAALKHATLLQPSARRV